LFTRQQEQAQEPASQPDGKDAAVVAELAAMGKAFAWLSQIKTARQNFREPAKAASLV
jgi:hypothetical protein